jgi:hypothetical protein
MNNFTINRELCELDYIDKDLKSIDVDVLECVWKKIRDTYQNPTTQISIGFTEMRNEIGRYSKSSLVDSAQRLGYLVIETNQKSLKPSQQFTLDFSVSYDEKFFTVGLQPQIFTLFNKPESYNEYSQSYVFGFEEKYSKLLYKFLIGYKLLKRKSFFVYSHQLMKIMNIRTDKPLSKIQSDIFKSSIDKINKLSDLNVSLEKESTGYDGTEPNVKYRIIINKWKEAVKMNTKDLISKKSAEKSEEQKRIDVWINDLKSDFEYDDCDVRVPMLALRNPISHLPIFIDTEYRLCDVFQTYTDNPKQTSEKINELVNGEVMDYEVQMYDGYSKNFGKMCLLTPKQLKDRKLI